MFVANVYVLKIEDFCEHEAVIPLCDVVKFITEPFIRFVLNGIHFELEGVEFSSIVPYRDSLKSDNFIHDGHPIVNITFRGDLKVVSSES